MVLSQGNDNEWLSGCGGAFEREEEEKSTFKIDKN